MTKIEWTEATWNPIVGCSLASPGCTNCYAMQFAGTRLQQTPKYDGLTQPSKAGPVWTGKLAFDEKALLAPLGWKKARMVFVNSMGDLFHEDCPDEWIDRVFAVMILAHKHTFQVLTKRSARMREYLSRHRWHLWAAIGREIDPVRWRNLPPIMGGDCTPVPNVWLGVSVEDQQRADERIPDLLATPAAIRWISAEPLLGPVDLDVAWHGENALDSYCWGDCAWCENGHPPLTNCHLGRQSEAEHMKDRSGLDWVVAGGESGKHARPMHPDWARALRDQCAAAEVPFFFKQWGEWAPACEMGEDLSESIYHPAPERHPEATRRCKVNQCVLHNDGERFDGEAMFRPPAFWQGKRGMTMFAIGKKRAGRLLDGVEHNGMPEVAR